MSSPVDRLVYALKYEGWSELAEEMGRTMAGVLLPGAPAVPTVVAPVPTTPARLRERGYNQAELLARSLARTRGVPLVSPLVRIRGGPTQVSLRPSQRLTNVDGVFAVNGSAAAEIRGENVLLVDDVLTTGATAGSAASALVRGGARNVTLVTFARALPFADSASR